jgi:peptide deformylase
VTEALPMRMLGDPVLREIARPVGQFDATLERLAADLLIAMHEYNGVGVAAPQIGVSTRFFVYDDGTEEGPRWMANPELVSLEGEQIEDEGCLSVPGLFFPTARAMEVTVRGLDEHGEPVELVAEGLLARIFQHETDHLNGMLYLDRLSEEDRREAMRRIRERDLELAGGES